MSDTHGSGRHADQVVAPHDPQDHGADGGHDDHAHAEEPLGPIDVVAWVNGALGVVLGLLVAGAFAVAAGWIALA